MQEKEKIKHNRMNSQGSIYIFMALTTSIPTIVGILNTSTVGPIRSDIDTMTEGPKYHNMTNLYKTLLKNYDTRVRPRKDLSNARIFLLVDLREISFRSRVGETKKNK